jgi:hypothetical protein
MFKQYRKTLIPSQILILAICAFFHFSGRSNPRFILLLFIAMQLGAVLGAWWGSRLKRQIQDADKRLPLENRRR